MAIFFLDLASFYLMSECSKLVVFKWEGNSRRCFRLIVVSSVLMDGVKQNVNGSLTIVVRRDRKPSHKGLFDSLVIATSVQLLFEKQIMAGRQNTNYSRH